MRVLVTRPQPQADEWVERLRAAGVDAAALPLIGIAPAEDAEPLDAAWRELGGDAAPALAVFVSPNAVVQFFARRPPGARWPARTRAAAPGPGTAAGLASHGVPAGAIVQPAADSGQFDSESLWLQLRDHDWRGRHVWIVRGEGGRDWLADALRAAGADVRFVQAYRRGAPAWTAAERARCDAALAAPASHLWLFSSSEAAGHLRTLLPLADWGASAALASHPRIADAARALGFGRVDEVRPEFDAVRRAIEAHAAR
jgi:uroporphyrinogen-III synthase